MVSLMGDYDGWVVNYTLYDGSSTDYYAVESKVNDYYQVIGAGVTSVFIRRSYVDRDGIVKHTVSMVPRSILALEFLTTDEEAYQEEFTAYIVHIEERTNRYGDVMVKAYDRLHRDYLEALREAFVEEVHRTPIASLNELQRIEGEGYFASTEELQKVSHDAEAISPETYERIKGRVKIVKIDWSLKDALGRRLDGKDEEEERRD